MYLSCLQLTWISNRGVIGKSGNRGSRAPTRDALTAGDATSQSSMHSDSI